MIYQLDERQRDTVNSVLMEGKKGKEISSSLNEGDIYLCSFHVSFVIVFCDRKKNLSPRKSPLPQPPTPYSLAHKFDTPVTRT